MRVFSAAGADVGVRWHAYDPAFQGGVRVASCDLTGDGVAEIITASGPGGGPHVRIWSASGGGLTELAGFFAYSPQFAGGVFVACGDVTGDGVREIITGPGPGGGPHVRVLSLSGGVMEIASFFAEAPAFAGGVHVAAGDVDGDGVAGDYHRRGPGWRPARAGLEPPRRRLAEVAAFDAYDPRFSGGVSVAAGDIDGDGRAENITGAGPGGGPHVRVLSLTGSGATEIASFFAENPT